MPSWLLSLFEDGRRVLLYIYHPCLAVTVTIAFALLRNVRRRLLCSQEIPPLANQGGFLRLGSTRTRGTWPRAKRRFSCPSESARRPQTNCRPEKTQHQSRSVPTGWRCRYRRRAACLEEPQSASRSPCRSATGLLFHSRYRTDPLR